MWFTVQQRLDPDAGTFVFQVEVLHGNLQRFGEPTIGDRVSPPRRPLRGDGIHDLVRNADGSDPEMLGGGGGCKLCRAGMRTGRIALEREPAQSRVNFCL